MKISIVNTVIFSFQMTKIKNMGIKKITLNANHYNYSTNMTPIVSWADLHIKPNHTMRTCTMRGPAVYLNNAKLG